MTSPGYRWPDDITVPCPSEAAYKRHRRRGEEPCAGDYAAAARAAADRERRRDALIRARQANMREAGIRELLTELIGVLMELPLEADSWPNGQRRKAKPRRKRNA